MHLGLFRTNYNYMYSNLNSATAHTSDANSAASLRQHMLLTISSQSECSALQSVTSRMQPETEDAHVFQRECHPHKRQVLHQI